jgi:hypothetical protein
VTVAAPEGDMGMQYRKMDLVLFDYKNNEGEETFRVFVQKSPAIDQPLGQVKTVKIKKELRTRLGLLEKRQLNVDELIALGTELGEMLFPDTMKSYVDDNIKKMGAYATLRIQLRINDFPLADLPWEYAYIPRPEMPPEVNFLALDKRVSLVRYDKWDDKVDSPPTFDPIAKDIRPRLITLMADPNRPPEYPLLKLEDERAKIEDALSTIEQMITSKFHSNVTFETLEDAIAGGMHVFHFAGHGTFEKEMGESFGSLKGKGSIVIFDDDKITPRALPVGDLVMLLRNTQVRLAVLGACETGRRDGESAWTGIAAALSSAEIPAVVSMQYTIQNKNAIAFSRAFYRTLAEHESVDAAVTAGRHAIYIRSTDKSERDWGVPVLYLRADDSLAVIFPRMPDVNPVGNYQPDQMRSDPAGALSGYHAGTGDGNIQSRAMPLTSKKCDNCGTENPLIAKFCMECQATFV